MLGSPGLGRNEFGVERVGEPRYDFVLHVEQVGNRLVETFGPEMVAGFGVNQLHAYAEAIAGTLYRALKDIADIQLASDLLHIDCLAFEGKCSIARNDERTADAR